jgi:hypothetical protein
VIQGVPLLRHTTSAGMALDATAVIGGMQLHLKNAFHGQDRGIPVLHCQSMPSAGSNVAQASNSSNAPSIFIVPLKLTKLALCVAAAATLRGDVDQSVVKIRAGVQNVAQDGPG